MRRLGWYDNWFFFLKKKFLHIHNHTVYFVASISKIVSTIFAVQVS